MKLLSGRVLLVGAGDDCLLWVARVQYLNECLSTDWLCVAVLNIHFLERGDKRHVVKARHKHKGRLCDFHSGRVLVAKRNHLLKARNDLDSVHFGHL